MLLKGLNHKAKANHPSMFFLTNNLAEQVHHLSPAFPVLFSVKNKTILWKVISPEKVSLQSKQP